MFFYMLFLRLAPVAPNVFLTMAAGLVGVPFGPFFFASFLGQIPFSILYIRTGLMLDEITSTGAVDFQVSILITFSSL